MFEFLLSHDQRREINALIRKSELIQVERTRKSKGRPNITFVNVFKKYISIKEVTETAILDRIEWKKIIHITDLD